MLASVQGRPLFHDCSFRKAILYSFYNKLFEMCQLGECQQKDKNNHRALSSTQWTKRGMISDAITIHKYGILSCEDAFVSPWSWLN